MTVAVTHERLKRTFELVVSRVNRGMRVPTNREIGLAIGMGQQKFQPWDRTKGIKWRKAEHGSVMIQALERLGVLEVRRIGRNRREVRILREFV